MGMSVIFIVSLIFAFVAGASIYSRGVTFSKGVDKEVSKISIAFSIMTFIMMIIVLNTMNNNLEENKHNTSNTVIETNKETEDTVEDVVESYNGTVADMTYTEIGLEITFTEYNEKVFIIDRNTILEEGLIIKIGSNLDLKYVKSENSRYIEVKSVKQYKTELAA